MAYHSGSGGSSSSSMSFQQSQSWSATARAFASGVNPSSPGYSSHDTQFDIFEWYPQFQSCVRYFLDHSQHSGPVQALAAFVNILLPFQRPRYPVLSSKPSGSPSGLPTSSTRSAGKLAMSPPPPVQVTLIPYIRRLVATGFDTAAVLHGFFGDDWVAGVGRAVEVERRNYLFAAKSSSWLKVKAHYDMEDGQDIPYLKPLQNVTEKEIQTAETSWSEWLAMQDWMVGPRSPEVARSPDVNVKREQHD